jgi:proteasome lid subunit RPN8/RPN11
MRRVYFRRQVVDSLLTYARAAYPEEGILLLRGKVNRRAIFVVEVVIPPLATHSGDISSFPINLLPADASLLGIAHSHPSGVVQPSHEDLLNFYGRMMVIMGYPYRGAQDIGVFDAEGNPAAFTVL